LRAGYVTAGVVLRGLGVAARYDPAGHRLLVTTPLPAPVASPTPFNPAVPSVVPSAVFTPPEPATPRPIWTGSPLPRRTALPVPPPHQGFGTHLARDALHAGTRALTTGTIQTAYPLGSRMFAII
jgi:hypothetical protein